MAVRTPFLLVLALASTAEAQDRANNDPLIHHRMEQAGFSSIAEMAFAQRDVRRVLPVDPYHILPIPGIELERHADGRLTMRIQYRGWTDTPMAVARVDWDRLARLEAAALASSAAAEPGTTPPGVVVHCWSGLVEATPSRAVGWSGCGKAISAAQVYADAVLDLAIVSAGCAAVGHDRYWRYSTCFAKGDVLDDPALQARLAAYRERWNSQRAPGSDILAAARTALSAARQTPSIVAIAEARDRVAAFGRQQAALHDIVRRLPAEMPLGDHASTRNVAIMERVFRGWTQDIAAQDANYTQLLESLVALAVPPTQPPP